MTSFRDFWFSRFVGLVLLIGSVVLAGTLHAEEDLEELLDLDLPTLMDMQVVTPSRKTQTIFRAPSNITVITKEMIQRRGYRTLEEVLKDATGFDFTSSQPAGEFPTHFVFRGVTDVGQTKTLVMVDGIVRNDVSNGWSRHVGYDFVLNDVEKIEIISGPGSALYGANAYAGLVNVITHTGGDASPGLAVEARGTFGVGRTLAPEVLARHQFANGLSVQLAGRWYKSDGDGGKGRPDPGHYFHNNFEPDTVLTTEYDNIANEQNADGTRKELMDGFRTDIGDVYLRGRIERDDFALGFTLWDRREGLGSEVVGYEYFTHTPGLDYLVHHAGYTLFGSYSFDFGENVLSRSRVYFRSNRILPETGFFYTYKYQSVDNGMEPRVKDKKKGYHGEGFVAGLEQQFNIDVCERSHMVLGLQLEQEIKQYHGISLGPEQDAASTIVRSTYTSEEETVQPVFFSRNAALYIQDEYDLGWDCTFTGGLRFDADDEYGHVVNPRLGLVRNSRRGMGFKLLYGRAFKAPTVFELFDEWRGNAHLEPEKIATGEIELSYRFSSAALVKAGHFYSRLADLIVVAPNPDPIKMPIGPNSEHLDYYQNIGSTCISGLSLQGDFQIGEHLYSYANYSCTWGEDGAEIDNISRHKANFGLNYALDRANINLRANWVGRVKAPLSNRYFQPKDAATIADLGYDYVTEEYPDGYMDGHFLVHLTLTGRELFGDTVNLTPQIIVRNLLDATYTGIGRQSGSGARPVDASQPLVQNPSGFIPPYHPQPGREIYVALTYDLSL